MKPVASPLVLSLIAALAACDEAAPGNEAPASDNTPLGKADSIGQRASVIEFDADFTPPQASPALAAGGEALIAYDTERFYDVYDGQAQHGWFASTFHCYGYGCCEVDFPEVAAHHRFDGGEVATQDITDGETSIAIPEGAGELEMWFSTPGFEIRTWYCGCDEACAQENYDNATPQWHELSGWDSAFGSNYRFEVSESGAFPVVHGETVKLVEAEVTNTGCSSCGNFSGVVEVANLAYDKNVEIWFTVLDGGGDEGWQPVPAEYLGAAEGGAFERWSFATSGAPFVFGETRFAIRYEVDGAVYWDNNCGWDYQLLGPGDTAAGQGC